MTRDTQPLQIRAALMTDIPRIAEIYAAYVTSTTVSFELVPPELAEMERRWRAIQALKAPYLVAESAGQVVGYAYAGAYRSRPAYAYTVENSIYLNPEWTGQGIGRLLLERLIDECTARGFAQMVAVIAGTDNRASIKLHQSCGFVMVGRLQKVGFKFGQWLDSTLMQRAL